MKRRNIFESLPEMWIRYQSYKLHLLMQDRVEVQGVLSKYGYLQKAMYIFLFQELLG